MLRTHGTSGIYQTYILNTLNFFVYTFLNPLIFLKKIIFWFYLLSEEKWARCNWVVARYFLQLLFRASKNLSSLSSTCIFGKRPVTNLSPALWKLKSESCISTYNCKFLLSSPNHWREFCCANHFISFKSPSWCDVRTTLSAVEWLQGEC